MTRADHEADAAVLNRWMARAWAAEGRAAEAESKLERLKVFADSIAGEREALIDDVARLSTEIVSLRRADVTVRHP